jgi:hypothetical protein
MRCGPWEELRKRGIDSRLGDLSEAADFDCSG